MPHTVLPIANLVVNKVNNHPQAVYSLVYMYVLWVCIYFFAILMIHSMENKTV